MHTSTTRMYTSSSVVLFTGQNEVRCIILESQSITPVYHIHSVISKIEIVPKVSNRFVKKKKKNLSPTMLYHRITRIGNMELTFAKIMHRLLSRSKRSFLPFNLYDEWILLLLLFFRSIFETFEFVPKFFTEP